MTAAAPRRGALLGSPGPLLAQHDVALLDLDGVVYLGAEPVPGAAAALAAATAQGLRLGFVTNNASRSPEEVAAQLVALGVPADPAHVVTSSQTAARVLSELVPAGSRVLVVGTAALAEQVAVRGLVPVTSVDPPVDAVVQGYSPDTGWRELAAACRAVAGGAVWIATNADPTVPSVYGPLPGNGAFVSVVASTTRRRPQVTGKPEPSMHAECVTRLSARRPIVVGDRLDTDIEGAERVDCPSMLVFTGVTRPAELIAAPPEHRPTYVSPDLRGLLEAHPPVVSADRTWRCAGWLVTASGGRVELRLADDPAGPRSAADPWSALRAVCTAAWATGGRDVDATDPPSAAALGELGLA